MVRLTIDGIPVEVPEGTTILQAAEKAGIGIPHLCYHPDLKPSGSCGVCVVEIEGMKVPRRSCSTPVSEGMIVKTDSKKLREIRRTIVELLLSNHNVECPSCPQQGKCELETLANFLGVDTKRFPSILTPKEKDTTSLAIVRDINKCILCQRCVTVCKEVQSVSAISMVNRGIDSYVGTFLDMGLGNSVCVYCGQCVAFCPTGALSERSEINDVWDAILDPDKHVVVQEAPSIRVSLGEEFGMEPGTVTTKKMYAALKKLGFDAVFDTNFGADLTIMEEAHELIERIKNGGKLPLITSCSPGWIKFMETFFPDIGEYVSTCKSPQQMFGAIVKTYYAKEKGIDPAKIVSVSIMPCTAKKFEARRPEMRSSGYQDVDYVLTTRELARMLKSKGIDLKTLPEEEPSGELGMYSGAGTIFGATGGVMEAALRTAYYMITGKNMENPDIKAVRGMEGIKEAEVDIDGNKVKVAVAHGLGNARKLLEKVRKQIETFGKSEYTFIEIMACPGGCVGGGGQPYGSTFARRARRGEGLYKEDENLPVRFSHENPAIKMIYEKFLEKPGSHVAHKLIHTTYNIRDPITGEIIEESAASH